MLKKDTKLQQEELIDKYLKDEINILQFIKEHNEKNISTLNIHYHLIKKLWIKLKKISKNIQIKTFN